MVGLKLSGDYYKEDPRHWESLFERLVYDKYPLETDIFSDYQLYYRTPTTSIPFKPYDKAEWMSKPEELASILESPSEFLEYRILGVEETISYILPLTNISSTSVSHIPPARYPIPENTKLFNSLYRGTEFVRFLVRPYDALAESNAAIYYPFLRATTPSKLTEESIRLL